MEVLYPRCAGLDVHSATVVACVRIAEGNKVRIERQTFGTTTQGLLELADWLESHGCTHAAMESTGVFWKPVWHILAERFELVLANATHIKNVPGRKSDQSDAQWIADLLAHGLIRSSFVPPPQIQELRDLTRTRRQMVGEITRHKQRILKTLEDANLKPGKAMSDVFGLTGRKILGAIVAGESNPERLADLAEDRLRAPRSLLLECLRGRITGHHRFMVRLHLQQIDSLQEGVRQLEGRVEQLLAPFRDLERRLMTIPGISQVAAQTILAEVGTDVARFPTSGHLVSWAGLCPGLAESAGKVLSTRTRHGDRWLKPVLVQCAIPASNKKNCYYGAQFRRIRSRRGGKKAMVAVAASLLVAAYHVIRDGTEYIELGPDHLDRRNKDRLAHRFMKRLKELGYEITVKPAA